MAQTTQATGIVAFDEIAARYQGDAAVQTKLTRTKIKKEAELRTKVSEAQVAVLDAQTALEEAIITDGKAIDVAAKALQNAERTYEFYQELYSKVFPNA